MTLKKIVIPLLAAVSLVACASAPETKTVAQNSCVETERATGTLIAKREVCADRSPEAIAAAQAKAQAMRDQQIREVVQKNGPGG